MVQPDRLALDELVGGPGRRGGRHHVIEQAVGLAVAVGLAASAGLEGPKQSAAMNSVPVTRWIHECFRVLVSSFTCLRLSSATDAHPQDR